MRAHEQVCAARARPPLATAAAAGAGGVGGGSLLLCAAWGGAGGRIFCALEVRGAPQGRPCAMGRVPKAPAPRAGAGARPARARRRPRGPPCGALGGGGAGPALWGGLGAWPGERKTGRKESSGAPPVGGGRGARSRAGRGARGCAERPWVGGAPRPRPA
ncbi:MAG: hypothetical protein J3K34DRAFT_441972, partial [Monoraphidium minutum]